MEIQNDALLIINIAVLSRSKLEFEILAICFLLCCYFSLIYKFLVCSRSCFYLLSFGNACAIFTTTLPTNKWAPCKSEPLKKKVSPRILATASKLVLQRSSEALWGLKTIMKHLWRFWHLWKQCVHHYCYARKHLPKESSRRHPKYTSEPILATHIRYLVLLVITNRFWPKVKLFVRLDAFSCDLRPTNSKVNWLIDWVIPISVAVALVTQLGVWDQLGCVSGKKLVPFAWRSRKM